MAYAEDLTTLPRIRDANKNRFVTKYAIHLYVDTEGVRLLDRFLVPDNFSVPCMLGTEFIEQKHRGGLAAFAEDRLAGTRALHEGASSANADLGLSS